MKRDESVYLQHILDAIAKIDSYLEGVSEEAFSQQSLIQDGVIRQLEIIGEAVKMIPESIRLAHPNIEWKKIAGLRDILAHQYFGVDIEIIWDVLENKLPALAKEVDEILST